MMWLENIKVALGAIAANRVRAVITMFIIGLGIMALVSILTSIDALKANINDSFSSMGANTFNIRNRSVEVHFSNRRKSPNKPISYQEARAFETRYNFPARVSLSQMVSFAGTVKGMRKKTNPNVQIIGSDNNYMFTSGYNLTQGRNFTQTEVDKGSNVAIVGWDVKTKLFGDRPIIDSLVTIGPGKYRVVGVLEKKGSTFGMSSDRSVVITLNNARTYFPKPNQSHAINIMVGDPRYLSAAIGEATGVFRTIRRLNLSDEENFEINKSDSIASSLISNLAFIGIAATIIAIITLIGAAIGLMNIMLVSVTERTREIGIRKSLGATEATIRMQFLTEALVIGQMGGLLGIVLGIAMGNVVSLIIGGNFIIPWAWIGAGVLICVGVSLVSGIYPAAKAARLDPIDALRYE